MAWAVMVKTTINVDEKLWKRFSMLVIRKRGGRKKNEVVEELLRGYVEAESPYSEAMLAFEEERSAFEGMLDRLRKQEKYVGKYVAVLHGRVIDSDVNKRKLVGRVYERSGYVPLFVGFVGRQRTVEVPSPERG